jgi:leader peptidase (prepilin peptidase)/N-methyltransferase
MTTIVYATTWVAGGLIAGEVVVRSHRRYRSILNGTNFFPGATLWALAVGLQRLSRGDLLSRAAALAIWMGSAAAPVSQSGSIALAAFLTLVLIGALIDSDNQVIPDEVSGALVWGGLLANVLGVLSWTTSPEQALVGVVLSYGAVWLVAAGYCIARKVHALGHGDLKFLAGLVAWLGLESLPLVLITSIAIQLMAHVALRRKGLMAFGPALAIAGAITIMLKVAGFSTALGVI